MPQFVVKHGSIKVGSKMEGVGSVVELTEADAKLIDPDGTSLITAKEHDAEEKAAAAAKAAKAKALEQGDDKGKGEADKGKGGK